MSAWDIGRFAVVTVLLWTALARGAVHGWPLAVAQLLTLFALGVWLFVMMRQGVLEWRRSPLDGPLGAMFLLIGTQIALGNGSLRAWALAPPTAPPDFTSDVPSRFWLLGTVAPVHTWQALGVFAMYVAAYVLVVNVIHERRHLQRFIGILLCAGSVVGFAGLLDYMVGQPWLIPWKEAYGDARVRGPFNNPDHFAAWLTMLVCLGVGVLAGTRGRDRGAPLTIWLASRRFREVRIRRYLRVLAIVIMSLAVIFTLSRGGIMSLMVGFGIMLLLFGRVGWMRWSAALAGVIALVTLIYASWIGLGPLLARIELDPSRWLLLRATLPILGAFPLFGTGLGTYGDIFFRYQPLALQPTQYYVSDAHNDVLQLVVETGMVGAVIAAYAAWRLARDLVGTHLFGRGSCPVGGGVGNPALRHDRLSVGIAVGALGAVSAFAAHCLVEFPARIPANGVLAAACLGMATVALHTRFAGRARPVSAHWSWSCGHRRAVPFALGFAALAAVVLVPWIVRPARIESALAPRPGASEAARIEAALAIDPGDPGVLAMRGTAGVFAAGQAPGAASVLPAIADLRAALAAVPPEPFVHERLGWAYAVLAQEEPARAPQHVASAVAHLKRAIAMAPENALFRSSLAALAATQPATLLDVAFDASRATVERDPKLLPHLVDQFDRIGLTAGQWLSVVPSAWPDRLELGRLLEARQRFDAAEAVYRAAIDVAPADERAVGVWMLAALMTHRGSPAGAVKAIEAILPGDPGDPELLLAYGRALEAQGNPAALEAYRAAAGQRGTGRHDAGSRRLRSDSPRIRALIAERTGGDQAGIRYRRALARYLIERHAWDQAGAAWDGVLSMAPKDAGAHFFRGVAWEGVGEPARAIEQYQEAVALDDQPRFRLRLARLLWDTENYAQAMNEWRAVLRSEPDNVDVRLRLAHAHLKDNDRVAAYHEFQRILTAAPDHPVARRELARMGAFR